MDPRRSRERSDDKRPMRDYHDPRSRILNEPSRRPSPPHRQRNAGWDRDSTRERRDMGTDFGNVYILDDDQEARIPQRPHEPDLRERDQTIHDLNNGTRPSNRVPLRSYADDNPSHERRPSFDSSNPPDNHDDAINEHSVPQTKVDSENEYEGPHFEEPEDYIIANIPPGAEAYHEHSMKLKGRNKVSASMIATRKLSDAGKEQESGNEKAENLDADLMSPDSTRDKPDDIEDLTKSPSLPLKKRKYVISPGRVEDPDAANDPEAEMEVTEKDSPDTSQKRIPEVDHHSVIDDEKIKNESVVDDSALLKSEKADGSDPVKYNGDKSEVDQKDSETANGMGMKKEKSCKKSKDKTAETSELIKSEKAPRPSEIKKKSDNKERIRPLLSSANAEPIKKKRKRNDKGKAKDRYVCR